jgi:C4-dicarboxylate-binding protein DctP
MTGVSGVKSRKLWDVMDTITKTQHADIEFVVVVNEEFWNGLPEEHRAIITAAADMADKAVRDQILEIEGDAYAAAAENGMKIVEPSADQIAQWRDCSQAVYEQYGQTAGELGQTVMEAANALRGAN